MELKEFIKATITAITESVEELNDELIDKAVVNPKNMYFIDSRDGKSDKLYTNINQQKYVIHDVEFNLAITEAKKNERGGGIRIEVISAGVNSKKEIENINTVKFSIPVAYLK